MSSTMSPLSFMISWTSSMMTAPTSTEFWPILMSSGLRMRDAACSYVAMKTFLSFGCATLPGPSRTSVEKLNGKPHACRVKPSMSPMILSVSCVTCVASALRGSAKMMRCVG